LKRTMSGPRSTIGRGASIQNGGDCRGLRLVRVHRATACHIDIRDLHDTMSDMKMTTRTFSRQLAKAKQAASAGKTVEVSDEDTGKVFIFSLKRRANWQFAPDAIGMVDGPADLSQRKGLSG
jgi:hypothetical protein